MISLPAPGRFVRRCFGLVACAALAATPAALGEVAKDEAPAAKDTGTGSGGSALGPGTIRVEIETGVTTGKVTVSQRGGGFSGTGFVEGFVTDADRVTAKFSASAGIYDVTIRYRAPIKGFVCEVNGRPLSGKFADSHGAFAGHRFGKVELHAGENSVAFHSGWHRYEIDRVDFTPVMQLPELAAPSATLCDPKAIPAARALHAYLLSNYGKRTLSGTIQGPDVDYVREVTGELPAIIASDLLNVTTTPIRYQGIVGGEAEAMIERARQGHILTYCWHWRAPADLRDTIVTKPDGTKEDLRWYKGFYTTATTFDIEQVLAHPRSSEYALLLADIDMVAAELRKFADWNIPILWRPLHESEGMWFWWGAKGPKPFIQLWRLVHDRLTQKHGLHNLIWVFTGTGNRAWYPGDDVVDIVGFDEYPLDLRDPLSASWEDGQATFGGKKLVALSEVGGAANLVDAPKLGVRWSYFASWSADLGPKKLERDALRKIYLHPAALNLRELPRDRWAPSAEQNPPAPPK